MSCILATAESACHHHAGVNGFFLILGELYYISW